MNRLRKMKGFTLIELIVVVVILGVLVAVAAVGYNKFVGDARDEAIVADGKKVAQVIDAHIARTGIVPDLAQITEAKLEEWGLAEIDATPVLTADPLVLHKGGVCVEIDLPAAATDVASVSEAKDWSGSACGATTP